MKGNSTKAENTSIRGFENLEIKPKILILRDKHNKTRYAEYA